MSSDEPSEDRSTDLASADTGRPAEAARILPEDHPLRGELTQEVHARPFASLEAPERVTHLALISGEGGAAADRAHLAALCRRFDVAPPAEGDNHLMADFGAFRLKWERHSEFSTYTFMRAGLGESPFAETALDAVPAEWLAALPGEVLVAIQAELWPSDAPEPDAALLNRVFRSESFAGCLVSGGAAAAWMDFAMNEDGFGRLLVHDRHLRSRQAGRLLQRLFEIETYRVGALLAFPLAKESQVVLTRVNEQMLSLTERMAYLKTVQQERSLLEELTGLTREVETAAARTGYRFGAARAYHALVERRIVELREERVEGYQTVAEFMDRRLSPAMRTCEAVSDRIDRLSRRLARAGQLLRTRVDIQLEAQNQDLLISMNRRAKLQLRLQETVEGLSVAAITYYLVGLVGYAAKGAKELGAPLPVEVTQGLAIPVVAGLVWYSVRRIRRLVARSGEDADG